MATANDPVLTDSDGRPISKPDPEEFETGVEFVRAFHEYRRKIEETSWRAFDEQFPKSIGRRR